MRYNYNSQGYLASVQNVSTSLLYWQADAQNAEGQLTQFTLGNGVSTQQAYTPQTGLIDALGTSTPLGVNDVQNP